MVYIMKGRKRSRSGAPSRSAKRTAKVFWSGRSQAVRLPKEFRFDTVEVSIHREGTRVVLEPVDVDRDVNGWPMAWWQLAGAAPDFSVGDRAVTHERGDVLTRRG